MSAATNRPAERWILVVEDDDDLRDVITYVIEEAGFSVLATADGEVAMQEARSRVFCAAIIDLNLSGSSGRRVVDLVMALSAAPYVVVMTGESHAELPAQVAFLKKPFQVDALTRHLQAALVRELGHHSGSESSVPAQPVAQ